MKQLVAASSLCLSTIFGLGLSTAMTMGGDCPEYRYRSQAGLCCLLCSPGYFLVKDCTLSLQTTCERCKNGFYSPFYNNRTECRRCTVCDRGMTYSRNCTRYNDSFCVCPHNYFYDNISSSCSKCRFCGKNSYISKECGRSNDRECTKCKEDERGDGGKCVKIDGMLDLNEGEDRKNHRSVIDNGTFTLTVTAICVSVTFLLVMLVVGYCIYKRSTRNRQRTRYETRESSEGIASNYNCESSSACRDMSVQNLDYEVFSKLALKLNPRARRNWKNLAREMGYSIDHIRSLDLDKTEATQELLYDFSTQRNGTVRRLHSLLIKIKRKDAADILLPYLQQSPV